MAVAKVQPGEMCLCGPGVSQAGVSTTVGEVAEAATRMEAAGFDYFNYGDTVFREPYVALTASALVTDRVGLGPVVTNPVTRLPVVTAMAIASLDEASGGRAFLGIGMGQSANAIAGVPRASSDLLRSSLGVIWSAMRRARDFEEWPAGIEIDEGVAELKWVRRRVPVLVAAGFDAGLRIAAEEADGVMLRAGDVPWEDLPARVAQLHSWRADSRRAGDPFEIQLLLYTAITDDLEQGRAQLGGVVSARARSSTREGQLPPEMRDSWRRYHDEYDYEHHASLVEPVNVRLMERLGLADYFYDRYGLVGDEDAVVRKLEEIEASGVTATCVSGELDRATRVLQRYRSRRPADAPPLPTSPLRPALLHTSR